MLMMLGHSKQQIAENVGVPTDETDGKSTVAF